MRPAPVYLQRPVPQSTLGIESTPEVSDSTGLSDIIELLKTPAIFRDMSGIEQLGPLLEKLAQVAGEVEERRLQENGATEREKIKAESKNKESGSSGGSSGTSSFGSSGNSSGSTSSGTNSGDSDSSGSSSSGNLGSGTSTVRERLGESQVFRNILNNGVEEGWISEEFAGEQYRQYAQNLVCEDENDTATDVTSFNASNIFHQRVLFANFPINLDAITEEHQRGLNNIISLLYGSEDFYIQLIEGRASNTGPESETPTSPGNIELSRGRANRVAQYILEALEDLDVNNRDDRIREVTWYGSKRPIESASGEIDVNRSVSVMFSYQINPPRPIEDTTPSALKTTHWAIYLEFSVSAHLTIGGWYASGYLKNRDTGEVHNIDMVIMGLGAGLASPGASGTPDDDDYVNFETLRPVSVRAFNRQYIRTDNVSGGLILGGGYSGVVIPGLVGPEVIQVYGGTIGTIGADASVGLGGILWIDVPE